MMTPDFEKAKQEAKKLIEASYITSPPVDVVEIAQSLGIDIQYINFGKKYNHVAGYIDIADEEKVIYVNKHNTPNRQTFTIAHELGHLVLHTKELKKEPDISVLLRVPIGNNEINFLEKEANCFAANLLVPKEFLDNYEENTDTETLSNIFRVSKDVIGFRKKFEYGSEN